MKMNKEIGNRIKTSRENASLTQDEVAKYLGISKEKYAGIELGLFSPTLAILNQLAKLFNVSVKTLTKNIKELNYADTCSFFLSFKISGSKLFYCKVDTFIEIQFKLSY